MGKGGARTGTGPRRKASTPEERRRIRPVPAPPDSMTAHEKEVWARLAAEVDAAGVYTASDWSAFNMLCRLTALWERALKGEPLDADRDGNPRPPPTSSVVQLGRAAAALLARFRLDPASRGSVSSPVVAPTADGPDLDDLRPLPATVAPEADTEH